MKKTKQIYIGNIPVGGGAPVSVQSMTNTCTGDADATLAQIRTLAAAGCDIIRCAVPDEAAAQALLAQVKGAYATDPVVAFQIGAVTQWVMLDDPWYCILWDGPHAAGRKVWTKALCGTIRGATDDYVKMFCLDQLRWCGCPCGAKCLAAFAAQEKSKAVKDFAEMVARELEAAE